MPIKVNADLPAKELLENENVFVMDETRALKQEIRPLQICILNLMPLKEETELQLMRALSNTPLQVDITFLNMETHISQNTPEKHLNRFYTTFENIKNKRYDGLIITGAPVEKIPFESVDYWSELCSVMDWSKKNVTSTLHICWGAQAALYYHFGIDKIKLEDKLFGIYPHHVLKRKEPLVRGFDDIFLAPHSRHTTVSREDIYANKELTVLAESAEAGVYLVIANEGKQIFVTGHSEYDRITLQTEYNRDKEKGLPIQVPKNYFTNNDPNTKPNLQWRSHSNNLFSNWLNYYVYQVTPYEL